VSTLTKVVYYLAAVVLLTALPFALGADSPELRMQLLYVSSGAAAVCGLCVAASLLRNGKGGAHG
jgi:hypothetical protein